MKRNQVQKLRVHFVPAPDKQTSVERANQYHIQMIERRLNESGLTPAQKVEVITKIRSYIAF